MNVETFIASAWWGALVPGIIAGMGLGVLVTLGLQRWLYRRDLRQRGWR